MTKITKQNIVACLIIILILLIDQVIKIEVKTNMSLHESHEVTSWFYIFFIENNGMAFGMSFINKILLTSFRLVAVAAISYYLFRRIRKGMRWTFLVVLSAFLAGAAGNLIDCMFYGLCFTESASGVVAQCVPFGEGYSGFFTGKVVDMFYFPLIVTNYPDWMPGVGGEQFVFFSPVFNFADAAVSCSVVAALLFCQKELSEMSPTKKAEQETESESEGDAPTADAGQN